mgnify:CR=1 FL=1
MADKKVNPKDYERFAGKVGIKITKKPSKKTVKRSK